MVTREAFRLENIIGHEALDVDVLPQESLGRHPSFELLVFDPGQMVGWAGVVADAVYENSRRTRIDHHIEVGQGPWHECRAWRAEEVAIERTPYAARRTFDTWPMYFTGIVLDRIYPKEPVKWMSPTTLKVTQKWFKLPRGHGLGPHAKDALTHLVHLLVTRKATE